jgi:phage host-nuclease inhibitor protein Gam
MSKENDAPAERLTRVFHKIKDKRAELAAEFKEKDDKLSSQLEEVKKALLDFCKEQG